MLDHQAMARRLRPTISIAPTAFTKTDRDLVRAAASMDSVSFRMHKDKFFGPDGRLRPGSEQRLVRLWQAVLPGQPLPEMRNADRQSGGPAGAGGPGPGHDPGHD